MNKNGTADIGELQSSITFALQISEQLDCPLVTKLMAMALLELNEAAYAYWLNLRHLDS